MSAHDRGVQAPGGDERVCADGRVCADERERVCADERVRADEHMCGRAHVRTST